MVRCNVIGRPQCGHLGFTDITDDMSSDAKRFRGELRCLSEAQARGTLLIVSLEYRDKK
jgi:hypothetical protein